MIKEELLKLKDISDMHAKTTNHPAAFINWASGSNTHFAGPYIIIRINITCILLVLIYII